MKKGTILRNNSAGERNHTKYSIFIARNGQYVDCLALDNSGNPIVVKLFANDIDSDGGNITSIGNSNVLTEVVEHLQSEFEKIKNADNLNLESEKESEE